MRKCCMWRKSVTVYSYPKVRARERMEGAQFSRRRMRRNSSLLDEESVDGQENGNIEWSPRQSLEDSRTRRVNRSRRMMSRRRRICDRERLSIKGRIPDKGRISGKKRTPDTERVSDKERIPDKRRIPDKKRVPDKERAPDRERIPDKERAPDRERVPDKERAPDRERVPDKQRITDKEKTPDKQRNHDKERMNDGESSVSSGINPSEKKNPEEKVKRDRNQRRKLNEAFMTNRRRRPLAHVKARVDSGITSKESGNSLKRSSSYVVIDQKLSETYVPSPGPEEKDRGTPTTASTSSLSEEINDPPLRGIERRAVELYEIERKDQSNHKIEKKASTSYEAEKKDASFHKFEKDASDLYEIEGKDSSNHKLDKKASTSYETEKKGASSRKFKKDASALYEIEGKDSSNHKIDKKASTSETEKRDASFHKFKKDSSAPYEIEGKGSSNHKIDKKASTPHAAEKKAPSHHEIESKISHRYEIDRKAASSYEMERKVPFPRRIPRRAPSSHEMERQIDFLVSSLASIMPACRSKAQIDNLVFRFSAAFRRKIVVIAMKNRAKLAPAGKPVEEVELKGSVRNPVHNQRAIEKAAAWVAQCTEIAKPGPLVERVRAKTFHKDERKYPVGSQTFRKPNLMRNYGEMCILKESGDTNDRSDSDKEEIPEEIEEGSDTPPKKRELKFTVTSPNARHAKRASTVTYRRK